jgi:glutathione gamma-glutamylcysteinyltransferase
MAKYCVEDVPNLLKDESLNDVATLLSHLVESLPANAGDLIKWVIEVRRKEEGESSLSKEEKERLALKVSSFFAFLVLIYRFPLS